MVFSGLFFLLFFFVLCMAAVLIFRTVRAQNVVLLVFSLVFYAWGGPVFLLLLCAITLICWLGGRVLTSLSLPFYRKLVLFMTVAASLLVFVFFKYTNFFADTLGGLFGLDLGIPAILLPIGISFYTFQLLSYVADVYRGETEAQKSYLRLLLYASLFHQCVAGPIVRYSDVRAELEERRIVLSDFSAGVSRFAFGLAKKALLSNHCGALATTALATETLSAASSGTVFLGTLFYMLQIYLDFSAYSDMAIGMGRMCGFHYCENFNYPYIASSVTDFWRRWHMSLSGFFRDYVYIPLGGNRRGRGRQILNLLAVWALTGLWHGASWNYVLWGLYYFVFLVIEKFLLAGVLQKKAVWIRVLRHAAVLAVVWFGWILFYFEDLSQMGIALRALVCANGNAFWDLNARLLLLNNLFFAIVAILACTPVIPWIKKRLCEAERTSASWRALSAGLEVALPTVLFLLSFLSLIGNTYNPFLYFQF